MVLSFKRSDSLGYIITKWFNELKKLHEDFLDYYNELIDICGKKIHSHIVEILKNFGKESKGVLNVRYNEIILLMSNNSINFFELNELLMNYKQHLTITEKHELDYDSVKKFESFLLNEIEAIQNMKIIIRDIIKAGALVFKRKKSSRKNEDEFISHLKKYNRFISSLIKESPIREKNIEDILNELTNEIKNTQQDEIAKEKLKS